MKIITGQWTNPLGGLAANGSLKLVLSQDATTTSQQVAPPQQTIQLDSTGSIPSGKQLWFTDELNPGGTYYVCTVTLPGFGVIWGPEKVPITGASFDFGHFVPGIANIPPNSVVLPKFETNGTLNSSQTVLNLEQGSNIILTDTGSGNISIAASGDISTPFTDILTGTNTTATMTVGSGSEILTSGTGVVESTELATTGSPVNISNSTPPAHAGQILISQPGNTAAVWADPLVQGLNPEGSAAGLTNPVLVSGKGADGNQHDLSTDNSGVLNTNATISSLPLPTGAATHATQTDGTQHTQVDNFPATQPVSAVSLPLPTGAATHAAQTDGTQHTQVDNFPSSQNVVVTNAPTVSVSNFPATQPISAVSLPLPTGAATHLAQTDGTQHTQVDNFPATQAVSSTQLPATLDSGNFRVAVENIPSVSVSNFPATQPVSGTVSSNIETSGTALTSTLNGGKQSLDVNVTGGSVGNAAAGNTGAAVPAQADYLGAKDGSNNLQGLLVESSTNPNLRVSVFNGTSEMPAGDSSSHSIHTTVDNFPATQSVTFPSAQHVIVDSATLGTVSVSGTVTANIGTTNGVALDATVSALQVAQGSTTSGQNGDLIQGAVTTAAPTYITGKTNPLSLTTSGALRVDGSGATQPVSGTVTANAGSGTFTVGGTVTANAGTGSFTVAQGTAGNLNATVVFPSAQHVIVDSATLGTVTVSGTVTSNQGGAPWTIQGDSASGAAKAGNPVQIGGVFNTTQPTVTTGQTVEAQSSARGAQIVATGVDTFHTTIDNFPATQPVSGTVAVSNSFALDATLTGGTAKTQMYDGTNVIGTSTHPVKVDGSAATQPISGSISFTAPQHVIIDSATLGTVTVSGTVSANCSQTGNWTTRIVGNAGAILDGVITAATAPANGIATLGVYNTTQPAPTNGQSVALEIDQAANLLTFSGVALKTLSAQGTSLNNTQTIFSLSGCEAVMVQLTQTTTITAGAVTFEFTYDGANWSACPANCVVDPTSTTFAQIAIPYTCQASTNKQFLILCNGAQGLRIRTSTAITGTGTVTPNYALLNYDPLPQVSIIGTASSNLAQVNGSTVSTAASGVQKVGIVGNAGSAFDASVSAGAAPTNGLATLVQFNTTIPALTAAQTVVAQSDVTGAQAVSLEGRKATYSAFASFTAVAGDISVLPGSGTKTIKITRIEVSLSTSGTAGIEAITLVKRSAADTSGTSAAMPAVPHDSNNAAASAAPLSYTVAPTPGAAVGTIRGVQFNDQSASLPGAATWLWEFGTRAGAQPIVLRGTAQQLCINLGAAISTQTAVVSYEWSEE